MKVFLFLLIFFTSFSSLFSADNSTFEDDKINNSPKNFRIIIFSDIPLMFFHITNGDKEVSYDSNTKYIIGYNDDSFMAGINAFRHGSMFRKKNSKFQLDAGKIGFFAGTRF